MKLFVPLLLAAVAAGTTSAVQVRVHVHSKLYITPMGEQCAYDEKKDASMYPCQNGECVRMNSTYGKCVTKEEAAKYKSNVVPVGAKPTDKEDDDSDSANSYDYDDDDEDEDEDYEDEDYDDEDYDDDDSNDSEEVHRKRRHRGKPAHKKGRMHSKLYITPMGEQCAYDEKKDASMYPCQHGGECVRMNSTYGKCVTKEDAAKYKKTPVPVAAEGSKHPKDSADSYDDDDDDEDYIDVYDEDSVEGDSDDTHHKRVHPKKPTHKKERHHAGKHAHDRIEDDSDSAEVSKKRSKPTGHGHREHVGKLSSHKKLRHGKQIDDSAVDSDDSDSDSEDAPVCVLDCPDSEWCERGTNFCRKANHKVHECFNEDSQLFESGKGDDDGACVAA